MTSSQQTILSGGLLLMNGIVFGTVMSNLGPSLLDLRCLIQVDQETVRFLLLFQGLGAVILTPCSYWFLKRYHPCLTLAGSVTVIGVCMFALPFCRSIYTAGVVSFMQMGSGEFTFAVFIYAIHHIWPNMPRMVHMGFAASGIGATLTPLLMAPFLSEGLATHALAEFAGNAFRVSFNLSEDATTSCETILKNTTVQHEQFSTLLHIPYIMYGAIAIMTTFGNLYLYLETKDRILTSDISSSYGVEPGPLYICLTVSFIWNIQGISYAYPALLSSFGINSRLGIGLTRMSLMTSVFWFCLSVGRFFGAVLSSFMLQTKIIMLCMIGTSVGALAETGTILSSEGSLWSADILIGLFSGPMVAAALAWSADVVAPSPKMTSINMTATAVACIYPFLCSIFMTLVGNDGFVYFYYVSCFVNLLLLIALRNNIPEYKELDSSQEINANEPLKQNSNRLLE